MSMKAPPANFDDEISLVAEAASTPEAFTELYRQYYARVFNYIRYRSEDPSTAEDLTALLFERLLTRISAYRPERGPFSAWLFAIARNLVNGHLRSIRRRSWISIDALNRIPSQEVGLEESAIWKETKAEFLEMINRLDERERDLLGLKFGARLTNRQIAQLTGLSDSNVGVILYRTLSRLRKELTENEVVSVGEVKNGATP